MQIYIIYISTHYIIATSSNNRHGYGKTSRRVNKNLHCFPFHRWFHHQNHYQHRDVRANFNNRQPSSFLPQWYTREGNTNRYIVSQSHSRSGAEQWGLTEFFVVVLLLIACACHFDDGCCGIFAVLLLFALCDRPLLLLRIYYARHVIIKCANHSTSPG